MTADNSLVLSSPTVLSKADPSAIELLMARGRAQHSSVLKETFQRAKEEVWSSETLAEHIASNIDAPLDVAQYLADEYLQLGEGIFIISTITGKVIGTLREEDIYLPAPVPREGSDRLAQPLPRIRPDIEAAIILQGFEDAREKRILETLQAKGHQTELLIALGDPRLLVATRLGRRSIVEDLANYDPKELLAACGGTSAAFLGCFELIDTEPSTTDLTYLSGTVFSKSIMGVQDPTTFNLRYDRALAIRAALVQGWVREIAGALSSMDLPVQTLNLNALSDRKGGLYVAAPHLVRPIWQVNPDLAVLPVSCRTYCISKPAGYIRVPKAFKALNKEVFDRWEASSYLDYEIWYDPRAFQFFEITGIDETPQVLLVDTPR